MEKKVVYETEINNKQILNYKVEKQNVTSSSVMKWNVSRSKTQIIKKKSID